MAKLLTMDQFNTNLNTFAAMCDARFAPIAVVGKVNTLVGSDSDKSVRTIANEELAAQLIPANAKEALDTLQEIAAWIQDHPDEAAAINSKLTLGTHEVEGAQVQYTTVKAYVEAYVAAQIGGAALQGSSSVSITNGIVSAIVNAANGLSIDGTNGISMALVTASTNGEGGSAGAMSAADKEKLDSITFATDAEVAAAVAAIWSE